MGLKDLLTRNEATILRRWFDLIAETYPADAAALMRKDKDRFTNPVGATISREIEVLFKGLCGGSPEQASSASLDAILKIRSVQDLTPSKAVGFVFLLKRAIGETLGKDLREERGLDEWLQLQSSIDALGLRAFDIYTECREKICEIRVSRARAEKEMAFKMMERMGSSKDKHPKEENEDS